MNYGTINNNKAAFNFTADATFVGWVDPPEAEKPNMQLALFWVIGPMNSGAIILM